MSSVQRRILTALILILFAATILPVSVYARSNVQLSSGTDNKMNAMGDEAFIWYRCLLLCAIPVLIVRYASYGFQLLGNGFMTKGEYALDRIKKDIFYSTIALAALALLPRLLGWGMKLFAGSRWRPPSPSYRR